MMDNLSGLMPPRTPHQSSFFLLRYKKKELWIRKKNNALLHFSTEKCIEPPLLLGEGWGEVSVASIRDCAKHNPCDAQWSLKTEKENYKNY